MGNWMELYHSMYMVCLVGGIVGLTVAVILFVRMDMGRILRFFTGAKARKEIRSIEAMTELLILEEQKNQEEQMGGEAR